MTFDSTRPERSRAALGITRAEASPTPPLPETAAGLRQAEATQDVVAAATVDNERAREAVARGAGPTTMGAAPLPAGGAADPYAEPPVLPPRLDSAAYDASVQHAHDRLNQEGLPGFAAVLASVPNLDDRADIARDLAEPLGLRIADGLRDPQTAAATLQQVEGTIALGGRPLGDAIVGGAGHALIVPRQGGPPIVGHQFNSVREAFTHAVMNPTRFPGITASADAFSRQLGALAPVDSTPQRRETFGDGVRDGLRDSVAGIGDAIGTAYDLVTNPERRQQLADVMAALENPETRGEVLEAYRQETGQALQQFLNRPEAYVSGYLAGSAAAGLGAGWLAREATALLRPGIVTAARNAMARVTGETPATEPPVREPPRVIGELPSALGDQHGPRLTDIGLQPSRVARIADDLEAELQRTGGTPISGAGTHVALRDASRLAADYGGDVADWAKVTTSVRRLDSAEISTASAGQTDLVVPRSGLMDPDAPGDPSAGIPFVFEVHAYRNVRTGQIVEPKLIVERPLGQWEPSRDPVRQGPPRPTRLGWFPLRGTWRSAPGDLTETDLE